MICIFFCLISFGCKDPDINTYRERIEYSGFSAKLPSEKGWFMRKSELNPAFAMFYKKTDSKTHTIYGKAYMGRLEQEVKSIAEYKAIREEALAKAANITDSRFKLTEHKEGIGIRLTDRCLGYEISGVDSKPFYSPSGVPLSMVIYEVFWLDPKNPSRYLMAEYSERGLPEEICSELPEDAVEFFREIRVDTFSLLPKEK